MTTKPKAKRQQKQATTRPVPHGGAHFRIRAAAKCLICGEDRGTTHVVGSRKSYSLYQLRHHLCAKCADELRD
jgi:hypothetical protein